ncbi:MAG: NADH-quinone oxidoreductase subunit C [Siphonobacter sp.]
MTFHELHSLLTDHFGPDAILAGEENGLMPYIQIPANRLVEICRFLHDSEQTYFDSLSCLTGIDNGPSTNTIEVVYNLYSILFEHGLCLKVVLPRVPEQGILPVIPSVSTIWRTADWHEREAFDLMGIQFAGHPDLRRIFLPEDWNGHPLRKDYNEQPNYHGIQVKY